MTSSTTSTGTDSTIERSIFEIIDDAMVAIEKVNPSLKGVLPKDYSRPAPSAVRLGELQGAQMRSRKPPVATMAQGLDAPTVDCVRG